tara:strand:- start:23 stop:205 length:183 start_codon:yes stop_codon:yes gene_type:complete
MNNNTLKKGKILSTVTTVNGTLYKDEVVKIEGTENGDLRVRDATGKIWYVEKTNIMEIKK